MTQNTAVAELKTQISTKQQNKIDMITFIRNQISELGNALPSFITPERFVRVAATSIRRNPKLAQCTQMSLLCALFQSAQLGLEPDVEGQAYLIPYDSAKYVDGKPAAISGKVKIKTHTATRF